MNQVKQKKRKIKFFGGARNRSADADIIVERELRDLPNTLLMS